MTARGMEPVAGLVELDRTSLREQAMALLRTAVSSGEIQPGTRLVETELSAMLGISRGTLREALRQLEYEGLIEVGGRGRLTVRALTAAEIRDVFAVRVALEGLAAATISSHSDRSFLVGRMRAAMVDLQQADGSLTEMVEADLSFHRLMCELAGNASLVRSWEALTGPIRMAITFAGPARARINMSVARHQELLDAISSGDPSAAHAAIDHHMQQAAHTLLATQPPSSDQPGRVSTTFGGS